MSDWDAWIGRDELRTDTIGLAPAQRWLATLDRSFPPDDTLPQGYHWCLCLPDATTASLGSDGHPRREDQPESLLPPLPDLPRRMWASSSVEFIAPLRVEDRISRVSWVKAITEKTGSSGRLVFVEVQHETGNQDGIAVREVQSLVYRAPPETGTPPAPPPLGEGTFDHATWPVHRAVLPSAALLFRYSALTFNSHRIHYDAPYAIEEESYRGLVVHGPLTATLLLDLAQRELGDNALATFKFRGVSPAICGEMLHLVLRSIDGAIELGAFAADGRHVMSATATV